MTPKSFDPETSREMVGDGRARKLEEKARADADRQVYEPPTKSAISYWGQAQEEFELAVYHQQYQKRIERNQRKTIQAMTARAIGSTWSRG